MSKDIVGSDRGHGGRDPGAVGNGYNEKDFTSQIGIQVDNILIEHGVEVRVSRTGDRTMSLRERTDFFNSKNVKMVYSLHVNSFKDKRVRGLETYYFPNSVEGKKLATLVHSQLVNDKIFTVNRGVKTANFHILRETKSPAILVEMGFISNEWDVTILVRKQKEIALSIAKGILQYLGIKYQAPKPPVTSENGFYRVVTESFKDKSNAIAYQKELGKKGIKSFLDYYEK